MKTGILAAAMAAIFICACAKKEAAPGDQPRATVVMRDGTRVSGTVTDSSPSEITLAGDDNAKHTIPMSQVKRVDYDAPPAPGPASGSTASANPAPADSDAVHDDHYHPPQSTIKTTTYELAPGTQISVRNEETIDSSKAAQGQTYAAEVTRDVLDASGAVVIPRGSNAVIVIRSASGGGKIRGASNLVLDLQSVSVEGQMYQLSTADLAQKGKEGIGKNRRTAEYTGGVAAVGAIIGAIAGGGKGAAIGAASGAAVGGGAQVLTKGSIKVPAETVLTFQLDRALSVVAAQ